jgi:hypothetical protein
MQFVVWVETMIDGPLLSHCYCRRSRRTGVSGKGSEPGKVAEHSGLVSYKHATPVH